MGLEVEALRPVLDDGEPLRRRLAVLGEQHFGVFAQPFQILPGVDDLTALRLVGLYPRHKGGVFQVAHADHAVGHAGHLADFGEDDAVLASAPGVGGALPLGGGPDVLHSGGGQGVQLLPGNRLLNGGDGLQPGIVADVLLSAEAHALAPFRENTRATAPLSRTVIRLPAVL